MSRIILVVEDNEMSRDLLVRRLERHQFKVVAAADGKEGLDAAVLHQPEVILMDMRMPIMDGWSALKKMKEMPEIRHIPVIGVSATGQRSDRDEAMQLGCVAFETKPIDFDRLLKLIQSCAARAS